MNDNTKYGKLIQRSEDFDYPEIHQTHGKGLNIIDNKLIDGLNCNLYFSHWVVPEGFQIDPDVGHPPHVHRENELLFCIGTNPEDPYDLGGTFEISFGEEMERHIVTRSCVVCIPGGTVHGLYIVHETHRPWLFIRCHEADHRSELNRPDLLTPEQLASIKHWDIWESTDWDPSEVEFYKNKAKEKAEKYRAEHR